jgi:hypothetical protein
VDRLIDLLFGLFLLPGAEGKGRLARIVGGIQAAIGFAVVGLVVSLPVVAICTMAWGRWDEASFGLKFVTGSLGLLFVIIAVGSIGLFVRRVVCPAPGKGSKGSNADQMTWRQ